MIPLEFHSLNTGDFFSFEPNGPVFQVDDANFIDAHQAGPHFGDRMVMYRAQDGCHAHLANHEMVWLIVAE